VHVARDEAAARLEVGEQRRAPQHLGHVVEIEADARLVRDRRDVQRRVGRAAGRGDHGAGILEALARDEIARQRPAVAQEAHHEMRRPARERRALGIDRRQHRRARTARGRAPPRPCPSCWR
jgi:hypothetical protein